MESIYSKEVTHKIINTHVDTLMAHVYERRKDPDGFLYITYTEETTLGEE